MPALLHAAIDIHASASRVWDVLCALERYAEWNPFVTEASGVLRRGEHLDLVVSPPDQPPYRLRSKVLEAEVLGRITVQCGRGTDHSIVLEPTPSGVHLVQLQRYQRDDAAPLNGPIGSRIQLGLDMMNAALKGRAER